VNVWSPPPGGGISQPLLFAVRAARREENPTPVAGSLRPEVHTIGARENLRITVRGRGFVPGSVVRWNGSDRRTTVVSASELRAEIPASDAAQATRARVTVWSPPPGGGVSEPLFLVVQAPPESGPVGGAGATPGDSRPSPLPAAPPAEELNRIRSLISAADQDRSEARFQQAFENLANAEQGITSLRGAHPQSEEVRLLSLDFGSTRDRVRSACERLSELRRATGSEPPRCIYP
jgi:hypothetical protein